jgi:polar amino acid transport system substrate-binding protein
MQTMTLFLPHLIFRFSKTQKILSGFLKSLFFCTTFLLFNSIVSTSSAATPISTAANNPTKVTLLFSDAFVDKEKNLPMPERFYSFLKKIEKELNIEFNIQLYPWNRALNLATTQGDLIFGISLTAEREKIFSFSEPVTSNNMWLVTRAENYFTYTNIEDLKGKTIDIFRGAKYGGEFDRAKDTLFKIEESTGTYSQRLNRLHNKRVDAMIFGSEFTDEKDVEMQVNEIVKNELSKMDSSTPYKFRVLANPIFKDNVRFAILKGKNEQLINNISEAILKIRNKKPKTTSKKHKIE